MSTSHGCVLAAAIAPDCRTPLAVGHASHDRRSDAGGDGAVGRALSILERRRTSYAPAAPVPRRAPSATANSNRCTQNKAEGGARTDAFGSMIVQEGRPELSRFSRLRFSAPATRWSSILRARSCGTIASRSLALCPRLRSRRREGTRTSSAILNPANSDSTVACRPHAGRRGTSRQLRCSRVPRSRSRDRAPAAPPPCRQAGRRRSRRRACRSRRRECRPW
jgi:hypothetical protein